MATIEEDLNQLDKDLRQLKIEYEQFFGGGRNRPPADTQWRVEQTIKRYSEMGARMNFAQRFRFNNLTQSYAKYNEVWRKRLKQKEEGFVQRHYGAAARAIESQREKEEATEAASRPAQPAAREAQRGAAYVTAFSDPTAEGEKVEQLYRKLVEAKQQAGEKTDALPYESFKQFVLQKTEQLKKQNGKGEVEYAIAVEDGQVKLKARVKT